MAEGPTPAAPDRALLWGAALTLLATALRLGWVLAVRTVPVGDFAMYRESANYLSEFGSLDHGFIYMPGFVVLLALVKDLGGDLLAQKMLGVFFGGLGTIGVFVTALHLFDRAPAPSSSLPAGPAAPAAPRSCATAIAAGLLYALWPAGIAMASVVGTDVPAAALIMVAVACLCGWGGRRPWLAAVTFGLLMGLGAYVRAVALPLTALSAVYWLAARRRPFAAAKLTALSVATTLLVLSPWAARNLRHEGELFFTDCHGGITALIGTNPNSEGTYTRALNQLFRKVTGHSVLDEPHRQIDHAAYRLAKDWARFEPAYALGLGALRAQRLLDDEHLLLYWPIYRPGVLVPPHDRFFVEHRTFIEQACDAVGLGILVAFMAGVALAVAQRRALALTLLPFQLALTATYVIFFAEPRYRVPIEMMALPVAGFALVGLARLGWAVVVVGGGDQRARRQAAVAAGLTVILLGAALWAAPRLLAGGARLRNRHRWAVVPWTVDGQTRLARWRRTAVDLAREPGGGILAGAPDGVRLRPHPVTSAQVEVWLDGGDLPPGDYRLESTLAGDPAAVNARAAASTLTVTTGAPGVSPLSFTVARDATAEANVAGIVHHMGGPFHLTVTGSGMDIWITNTTLVRPATGP
ncbi:MAG: hypothetical protein QOI66_3046 [Myxococcales bacterium]|jgi:hypothetical protein|nr:hypothetical protein [Myxococcales bacterium]